MAGVQSSGTLLHKSARVRVACLASGVGRLRLHVENAAELRKTRYLVTVDIVVIPAY
jgi:hypothetical protein